jgi:hypothetical protein
MKANCPDKGSTVLYQKVWNIARQFQEQFHAMSPRRHGIIWPSLLLGHRPGRITEAFSMNEQGKTAFDLAAFLTNAGLGRKIVQLKAKGIFFSQGNRADSIFYLQAGRAKLTVVSKAGKEATITLVAAGGFPWRGIARVCGWTSYSQCNCAYSLYRDEGSEV